MNGEILYKKVYEDIVAKIKSGEYKNGDFLPSQETLANNFNVSIITIKKALEYAEQRGIVTRCKGRRAQINSIDIKPSKYKILLLTIPSNNRETLEQNKPKKNNVVLNIQNNWLTIITNSLLSELPENAEVLSAAYYRDQVIAEYDDTIIPKYDRIVLLGTKSQKLIDFLISKGKKVVLYGNLQLKNCAIVSNNDREISRSAVKYLISVGHKRIAFIGTNTDDGDFAERYRGYQEAHSSRELTVNASLLRWCKNATSSEGYEAMTDIILASYSFDMRPTAVFCGNDNLAYGALKAIQYYGLRCPEDISIIGVDNCLEVCEKTTPNLSSVDKNFELAGKKIAQILCSDNWENNVSIIKCNLIIRESVREIN